MSETKKTIEKKEQVTGDKLTKSDFESEKKLEDYVEKNIKVIFKNLTNTDYKKHTRQYNITMFSGNQSHRGLANARVDLYVENTEGKAYIIELKHPKRGPCENLHGITQLLFYKSLLKSLLDIEVETILLSTLCDKYVGALIKEYDFPITFGIIQRDKVFIFEGYGETDKLH